MNKVLRKRLLRELKSNFARYIALVLLNVLGMYIIVSVVASADTIIRSTSARYLPRFDLSSRRSLLLKTLFITDPPAQQRVCEFR